jgi:mannose-1-phosphate guanylyltransferase/mannose-6-phosphate isomerase
MDRQHRPLPYQEPSISECFLGYSGQKPRMARQQAGCVVAKDARVSSSTHVLPVIMSGGSGTRLWPLSTEDRPKQFHALASELSMIQDTALRFTGGETVAFLPPVVICNHRHGALAKAQLNALDIEPAAVILEPFGRNTACVAAVAAQWAVEYAPDALVLLLPADHIINDPEGFRGAIQAAVAAAKDHIVTFGIEPDGPETGYGYIQRADALYDGAYNVTRFVEKPDRETAEGYLKTGGYYWNAGIFLYAPKTLLDEAEKYCPEIKAAAIAALDAGARDGPFIALDKDLFAACPSEPIDVAVMEKTDRAAVVPCDIGWADVGSWSELWRQGPLDQDANFRKGEVLLLDTDSSLVWSDGPSVSVVGVSGLIVIATGDHVLVLPKDRAQDVKKIVDELKRKAAS